MLATCIISMWVSNTATTIMMLPIGMSLVALHNGGGVGIGNAVNGGFGLVLDGSERVDGIIRSAIPWDVMGGVARRNWARNENALTTVRDWNTKHKSEGQITLPYLVDEDLLDSLLNEQQQ